MNCYVHNETAAVGACISCGKAVCDRCMNKFRGKIYCDRCVETANRPVTNKSRIAAALLAFFLGVFGVHKFYLGQVGWGLVYLLFSWTGIPAIVAFIEFILLLVMSDEAFAEKYGTRRA